MHEYGLTQKLLDIALKDADSRRIKRVYLLIGSFSEEREDAIQFYWKDLARGSLAEDAELCFEHIKTEMKCFDCSGSFYLDENDEVSTCKYCYSENLNLLREEEVKLERIDFE